MSRRLSCISDDHNSGALRRRRGRPADREGAGGDTPGGRTASITVTAGRRGSPSSWVSPASSERKWTPSGPMRGRKWIRPARNVMNWTGSRSRMSPGDFSPIRRRSAFEKINGRLPGPSERLMDKGTRDADQRRRGSAQPRPARRDVQQKKWDELTKQMHSQQQTHNHRGSRRSGASPDTQPATQPE